MAGKRGAVAVAQRRHRRQAAVQAQFQDVFLGLQEWRALHPQAQFAALKRSGIDGSISYVPSCWPTWRWRVRRRM
jgi:hypothetical protein